MGDAWRGGRKLLDGNLRSGAIILYRQMMQEKTREFLANLFATPKDVHAHIELLVVPSFLNRMSINGRVAFRDNLLCQSCMATT